MHIFMQHTHEATHGFWAEYFALITDPAHLLFEFTFTVVFDLLVVALVMKKLVLPRFQKKLNEEFHEEHGLAVNDCVTSFTGHAIEGKIDTRFSETAGENESLNLEAPLTDAEIRELRALLKE